MINPKGVLTIGIPDAGGDGDRFHGLFMKKHKRSVHGATRQTKDGIDEHKYL